MPRRPRPTPLPRAELIILIHQHLERAGPAGMTKQELVDAIGPSRTSLRSIQRGIETLRHDGAEITCFGKLHRYRLDVPLPMPLEAPQSDDVLSVLLARAYIEPHVDAAMRDHLTRIVEDLDARARTRNGASDLPAPNALTSTLTISTRVDPKVMRRLLAACRRKTLRIQYESPRASASDAAAWKQIEPWAVRVHDGVPYLRAWAAAHREARTFSIAFIEAIEDVETAAPRQKIPVEVWGHGDPALGIDHDRPNVAVIRLRGEIARWVKRVQWHPAQKDEWLEPRELLERTVPYGSCRGFARRLVSLGDGIESISPVELDDEVVRLAELTLARRRRRRKKV